MVFVGFPLAKQDDVNKKQVLGDAKRKERETAQVYQEFVQSFSGEGIVPKFRKEGEELAVDDVYVPSLDVVASPSLESPVAAYATHPVGKRQIDLVVESMKLRDNVMHMTQELNDTLNDASAPLEKKVKARQLLSQIQQQHPEAYREGLTLQKETTNLYVGNLSPLVTEDLLRSIFSDYGRVISVRLVGSTTTNCAFVTLASRAEAEKAKESLKGVVIQDMALSICWARQVTSGAGNLRSDEHEALEAIQQSIPDPGEIVQVQLPTDHVIATKIQRYSRLVAQYGSTCEQAILITLEEDEDLEWLYPGNELHLYYLWRVIVETYAMRGIMAPKFVRLQRGKLTLRMPAAGEAFETSSSTTEATRVRAYYTRLEEEFHLSNPMTYSTLCAGNLRNFIDGLTCIDRHAFTIKALTLLALRINSPHVIHCIVTQLCLPSTNLDQKVACFYLLNDIMCNTAANVNTTWRFKQSMQNRIPEVMKHLRIYNYDQGVGRRVATVLTVWRVCSFFAKEFLEGLEYTFFPQEFSPLQVQIPWSERRPKPNSAIDGKPMQDVDMFRNLEVSPQWARKDFYTWYQNRDDIWMLRSVCNAAGLYESLADTSDTLLMQLFGKLVYTFSQQVAKTNNLPLGPPFDSLNVSKILARKVDESGDRRRKQAFGTVVGETVSLAAILRSKTKKEEVKKERNVHSLVENIRTALPRSLNNKVEQAPSREQTTIQNEECPTNEMDITQCVNQILRDLDNVADDDDQDEEDMFGDVVEKQQMSREDRIGLLIESKVISRMNEMKEHPDLVTAADEFRIELQKNVLAALEARNAPLAL